MGSTMVSTQMQSGTQKKGHGDAESESRRGQLAITDADFESLPQVVGDPDRVVFGTQTKSKALDAIGYVKRLEDGTIVHVEEVRTGRNRLAAVTMWKYPAAMDVDKITANPHPNVRDDGGRTPVIVVRGPGADKSATRGDQWTGPGSGEDSNIMMDAERNARSGI